MSDKKIEKKVVDFSAHGEKTLKQFVTEKLQSGISEELLPRTEHDFDESERTVSDYERMYQAVKERINTVDEFPELSLYFEKVLSILFSASLASLNCFEN